MNNHTPSPIERTVMRRVRTIHTLRPFVSGATLSFAVLALALWGIGREVWVSKVFENAPHTLAGALHFWLYAFEHTRLAVQALSLLVIGALVYLARASASALKAFPVLARTS